jgi:Spy/CpxP family protein refolding chaperone
MKIKLRTLICLATLALGALPFPLAQAQAPTPENGAPKKERREGVERIEHMRKRLNLTDAQVELLKPILRAEQAELAAMREKLGKDATIEERRAAVKAIRDAYEPKIAAILTDEQKAKIAEKSKKRSKRNPADGAQDAPSAGGPPAMDE